VRVADPTQSEDPLATTTPTPTATATVGPDVT
jgi:hypothetical protein